MKYQAKNKIDEWRLKVAQAVDPALREKIHINGHVRVRELPFKDEAEWRAWWLGEFNDAGQMIRPPRMSEKEKERYTVAESSNILVASGVTQLLNYVGSTSGSSTGFAQQFAAGNIPINQVNFTDTSVDGEVFRIAPQRANVSGTQMDISSLQTLGATGYVLTNCGLFGNGATSTLNSGTMTTHSLLAYDQPPASPQILTISYDYLISYI